MEKRNTALRYSQWISKKSPRTTSPPDEDTERLRGRPRDPAIGDSALAAARELLAEVGWDKTTMVAISERAGVGKPALYRRWPSKTHLVFEAVFGWVDESPPVADATDPDEWVRALV